MWRKQWHPTPVLLPGKSHGWRSLVGCSAWGCWGSDTTEQLHFHVSLSCIGEGNGNPLQCSCLENPRDGEAWWAAVCGVAQSRTRLKLLSSSSSLYLLVPYPNLLLPSSLYPLVTASSFSLCVRLFLFCYIYIFVCCISWDSTYKWWHRIFVHIWLTFLTF